MRTPALLLPAALSLSLALGACGSARTADAPADLDGPLVTEDPGGLPGSPLVDPLEVLSVAQAAGGLTKIAPANAVSIIDGFANALAQRAGSGDIVGELNSLKAELTSGSIDGARVGDLLQSLGRRTTAAAGGEGNYAVLGEALAEAGRGLSR